MDSKFYVSFEAARLLKEKGYDRECVAYYQHGTFYPYTINTQRELSITNKNAAPAYMEQYSAPTKAEAMDWLEGKGWQFSIMCADNNLYEFIVYFGNEHTSGYRETMLEAQDAAIITVLEKL